MLTEHFRYDLRKKVNSNLCLFHFPSIFVSTVLFFPVQIHSFLIFQKNSSCCHFTFFRLRICYFVSFYFSFYISFFWFWIVLSVVVFVAVDDEKNHTFVLVNCFLFYTWILIRKAMASLQELSYTNTKCYIYFITHSISLQIVNKLNANLQTNSFQMSINSNLLAIRNECTDSFNDIYCR